MRVSPGVGIEEPQFFGHSLAGLMIMKCSKQSLTFVVSSCLLLATAPEGCAAQATPASNPTVQATQQSAEDLDQLVAPIALYPDALIAQILAASANPTEIVEADRWFRQHSNLNGNAFAQAVNAQTWDPSVKALTQFPSVLENMNKNLAWTSALGDADSSNPQAVLDAVQVMRRRAEQAGNLKSTPQQTVSTEGQTVVIQPENSGIVYVPEYDPWVVYGAPVDPYPYWDPYPGLYLDGPGYTFALGIGIGLFAGFGWGWGHWGADWHGDRLLYNHHAYAAHRPDFGHGVYHGHTGFARAGDFHGTTHARVGVGRTYAAGGRSSFGGALHAGGFHGSAFHGGGFHGRGGGGGRR
jgi:hypothetical protein